MEEARTLLLHACRCNTAVSFCAHARHCSTRAPFDAADRHSGSADADADAAASASEETAVACSVRLSTSRDRPCGKSLTDHVALLPLSAAIDDAACGMRCSRMRGQWRMGPAARSDTRGGGGGEWTAQLHHEERCGPGDGDKCGTTATLCFHHNPRARCRQCDTTPSSRNATTASSDQPMEPDGCRGRSGERRVNPESIGHGSGQPPGRPAVVCRLLMDAAGDGPTATLDHCGRGVRERGGAII